MKKVAALLLILVLYNQKSNPIYASPMDVSQSEVCLYDYKRDSSFIVYPQMCIEEGYFDGLYKSASGKFINGHKEDSNRFFLWDRQLIPEYGRSVEFINEHAKWYQENSVQYYFNARNNIYTATCEFENELHCVEGEFTRHFCLRYLSICGFEESITNVLKSIKLCFDPQDGPSYLRKFPKHCIRSPDGNYANLTKRVDEFKICLREAESESFSDNCSRLLDDSFQFFYKNYLYLKNSVYAQLNSFKFNQEGEYYSNKLIKIYNNMLTEEKRVDYKSFLNEFKKSIENQNNKSLNSKILKECQQKIKNNKSNIDLSRIDQPENEEDYTPDAIEVFSELFSFNKKFGQKELMKIINSSELELAMQAMISGYKSFVDHEIDLTSDKQRVYEIILQKLKSTFFSLSKGSIPQKKEKFLPFKKVYQEKFEKAFNWVRQNQSKLKYYSAVLLEKEKDQINQKLNRLNQSCTEVRLEYNQFENKFWSKVHLDKVNFSSSVFQDQYWYGVMQPQITLLRNYEIQARDIFHKFFITQNDIGFIFIDEKNIMSIGVPGLARLKNKPSSLIEDTWMYRNCIVNRASPFNLVTNDHITKGIDALYRNPFVSFINEVNASSENSFKYIRNHLVANPKVIEQILNSPQEDQAAELVCKILHDDHYKQKINHIGKNALVGIGVTASIVLSFTGVGSPLAAGILAATIGLSTAGEVALLQLENQQIRKQSQITTASLYQYTEEFLLEPIRKLGIQESMIKSNNHQSLISSLAILAPAALNWVGKAIKNSPKLKLWSMKNRGAKNLIGLQDEVIAAKSKRGFEIIDEILKSSNLKLVDISLEELNLLSYLIGSLDNFDIAKKILNNLGKLNGPTKKIYISSILNNLPNLSKNINSSLKLVDELHVLALEGRSFSGAMVIEEQLELMAKEEKILETQKKFFNSKGKTKSRSRQNSQKFLENEKISLIEKEKSLVNYLVQSGESEVLSLVKEKFKTGLPTGGKKLEDLEDILRFIYQKPQRMKKHLPSQYKNFEDYFDDLWKVVHEEKNIHVVTNSKFYKSFIKEKKFWNNKLSKMERLLTRETTQIGEKRARVISKNRMNYLKNRRSVCKSPSAGLHLKNYRPFIKDSIMYGFLIGNATLASIPQKSRNDLKQTISHAKNHKDYSYLRDYLEYYAAYEGAYNLTSAFIPPFMKVLGKGNRVIEAGTYYGSSTALDFAYSKIYTSVFGENVTNENKNDRLNEVLSGKEGGIQKIYQLYGDSFAELIEQENMVQYLKQYLLDKQVSNLGYQEFLMGDKEIFLSHPEIFENENLKEIYSQAILQDDYELHGNYLNKMINTGSFSGDLFAYYQVFGYGEIIPEVFIFNHVQYLYCMGNLATARKVLSGYLAAHYSVFWAAREMVLPKY